MATVDQVNERVLRACDPRQYVQPMKDALDIVRNEEATFPPQPDRMRSGHLNTWVREVGRLPVSAFIRTSRAKLAPGTTATTREQRKRIKRSPGDILEPSEQMLRQWKGMPVLIAMQGDTLIGMGGNRASYSGYVQGPQQAAFHKTTGWLTTTEAYEKHKEKIIARFTARAMRILGGETA